MYNNMTHRDKINEYINNYNCGVNNYVFTLSNIDEETDIVETQKTMHEDLHVIANLKLILDKIITECTREIQSTCTHEWETEYIESGNIHRCCKYCDKPQ